MEKLKQTTAEENKSSQEETCKGKERKVKKKKPKKKVFKPPTVEDVKKYFKENGYTEISGEKAFNFYDTANWHDSRGNKVKNWKQKMQGVWFKDENKIPPSQNKKTMKDLISND